MQFKVQIRNFDKYSSCCSSAQKTSLSVMLHNIRATVTVSESSGLKKIVMAEFPNKREWNYYSSILFDELYELPFTWDDERGCAYIMTLHPSDHQGSLFHCDP